MRPLPTLALQAALVVGGLFAYDTLRGRPAPRPDPYSDEALALLQDQMAEVTRRRGGGSENMREARIADLVRRMPLGLPEPDLLRLVGVLEGFQQARLRFWTQPDVRAMDEETYATAYKAFIEDHVRQVQALVRDAEASAQLVRQFIWDGRIIRR